MKMLWNVTEVNALTPNTLAVHFVDGTQGQVRFEPSHLTGVFEPLKSPDFFRKVRVEDGVVTWPGEIDLAPDAMYRAIRQSGEWVLS